MSKNYNFYVVDGSISEELEKEDLVKSTTNDEPRLSEIVKEYKTLGYDVHLEPVKLWDLDED